MGYSASSYAVFGKATTRQALTTKTKERGCSHKIDGKQKFCSECGKPTWVQEEVFIADEELDEEVSFYSPSYMSDEGVLGFRLLKTDDEEIEVIPTPTPEMIKEILDFYEKHGIACTQKQLKTYMFTSHSC